MKKKGELRSVCFPFMLHFAKKDKPKSDKMGVDENLIQKLLEGILFSHNKTEISKEDSPFDPSLYFFETVMLPHMSSREFEGIKLQEFGGFVAHPVVNGNVPDFSAVFGKKKVVLEIKWNMAASEYAGEVKRYRQHTGYPVFLLVREKIREQSLNKAIKERAIVLRYKSDIEPCLEAMIEKLVKAKTKSARDTNNKKHLIAYASALISLFHLDDKPDDNPAYLQSELDNVRETMSKTLNSENGWKALPSKQIDNLFYALKHENKVLGGAFSRRLSSGPFYLHIGISCLNKKLVLRCVLSDSADNLCITRNEKLSQMADVLKRSVPDGWAACNKTASDLFCSLLDYNPLDSMGKRTSLDYWRNTPFSINIESVQRALEQLFFHVFP